MISSSNEQCGGLAATKARYVVLALLCAAAALSYLSRNCIAVAEETIRRDLRLSEQQMGWVMAAFFWTYALFQIPAGHVGYLRGSRRALPVYAVLWSLATAVTGLAGGIVMLLATRMLAGAAQAGLFPCSVMTISHWMPASRRAVSCGALASFMSIGGAAATALTGLLLDWQLDWRWVFVLLSTPAVVWAVVFHWWFRDRPDQHPAVNRAELAVIAPRGAEPSPIPAEHDEHDEHTAAATSQPRQQREPWPWGRILASGQMWMICGQQFFRAAGYIFYASWFPTFLKQTRGVTTAQSGLLTSLPLLAVVAGSAAGGWIIDWVYRRTGSRRLSRQGIAVPSMLLCAALIGLAYFAENATAAVVLITAGTFCSAFGGPCGYAITIDKGGPYVSTIFSLMNMVGNVGAAVCPVVVERFVHVAGSWDATLFLFAGIYLGAAVCWALLDPEGTIIPARSAAEREAK